MSLYMSYELLKCFVFGPSCTSMAFRLYTECGRESVPQHKKPANFMYNNMFVIIGLGLFVGLWHPIYIFMNIHNMFVRNNRLIRRPMTSDLHIHESLQLTRGIAYRQCWLIGVIRWCKNKVQLSIFVWNARSPLVPLRVWEIKIQDAAYKDGLTRLETITLSTIAGRSEGLGRADAEVDVDVQWKWVIARCK